MKREEITALFPEATEEQIKKIMDLNGSDINSAKARASTDKAELDRLKLVEEEFQKTKDASLTEAEKYQKAIKDMETQAKNSTRELNKMKAENILVSAGLKTEDFSAILDGLVKDTTEETVAVASGLASLLKSQKEATEKKVKADLLNNTTMPGGSAGNGTIDYNKKIEEATANGNMSEVAYYTRLQAQSQS